MPGILPDEDCCRGILPEGRRALKTHLSHENKGHELLSHMRLVIQPEFQLPVTTRVGVPHHIGAIAGDM